MSTESPVITSKPDLLPYLYILDIISDLVTTEKSHIRSGMLVLIIHHLNWYCKSLICPSHLWCCWVYVSLELPIIYKWLIIIFIIVTGIDSSLELSYLNYYGMSCSPHISITQILPYTFYFIGATNINSPEVNTCEILFNNSDVIFLYKGSLYKFDFSWW